MTYRLSSEAHRPVPLHDVRAALRWLRAHAGEYVLAARGQAEVTCEVDETNTASNALFAGLGARRVGGAVELMRPATA